MMVLVPWLALFSLFVLAFNYLGRKHTDKINKSRSHTGVQSWKWSKKSRMMIPRKCLSQYLYRENCLFSILTSELWINTEHCVVFYLTVKKLNNDPVNQILILHTIAKIQWLQLIRGYQVLVFSELLPVARKSKYRTGLTLSSLLFWECSKLNFRQLKVQPG